MQWLWSLAEGPDLSSQLAACKTQILFKVQAIYKFTFFLWHFLPQKKISQNYFIRCTFLTTRKQSDKNIIL